MKLLAAVLPKVRRLMPSSERGLAIFLVAFLVGLEFLGRKTSSELHDALAGTALISVILFVISWHRWQSLGWINQLARMFGRLASRFETLRYDVGIDFRGTPPLPRRLPRAVPVVFGILIAWGVLAVAVWRAYPEGWRTIGLQTSYILYLALLLIVWALLGACLLAGVYFPVTVLDQRMRSSSGEIDPRGVDVVVLVGYSILAVLIAWVTPPMYGLMLCLLTALAAIGAAMFRPVDDASILWRATLGGPICQLPLRRILLIGVAMLAMGVFDLLLTACGGRLMSPPAIDAPMPLTTFIGAVTAWLVPGVLILLTYQLWKFYRSDPTRREPATIRIQGPASPRDLIEATRRLYAFGFRSRIDVPQIRGNARKPRPRHPSAPPVLALPTATEVGIQLVHPEFSELNEFEPRWPLKLSLGDLTNLAARDRLTRRDEIQLRRRFYKGLAALLKTASATVPSSGGGFWLAPHWWFIGSLLWEEPTRGRSSDPDPLRPIGPPYHLMFGARVRQHLHQILRALQIDLIYVEHGVTHRKLEKVLRAATELYDIHGGKRRAEEHHFRGVPKVRVMMHDYAPGNPFRSGEYPEPKFDDVSRFRVLHVFKDRGGHEDKVEPPFDFSWEPSPMSIG